MIRNQKEIVSIITPVFNAVDFIHESIGSVIEQSFLDWELVLVDDCSSDNSVEIIQKFVTQDSRIKMLRLGENSGAAVARNAAIAAAKGRYIAFLDSDDVWMPHKLKTQLEFMKETGCPFSYSAYDKINEFGETVGSVGVPEKISYTDLLKTNVIGCLTVIYDTAHFGKVEMPLIRKRQDFGLWLRLLKQTEFACGIQTTLAMYREHSGSISANKIDAAKYTWRLYRDVEGLPLIKSMYYFANYAVRGVLRSKVPGLAKRLGVLS